MDKEKAMEQFKELMNMDEDTFADKARKVVAEVMHKLEDLQKTIQDNRALLSMIDFGCIIGMSIMGPANIEDPDEQTEEYPGHILTRTVVGDKASCKAISIVLTKHIRQLSKEETDE